jgi:ribonuclease HI
MFFPPGTNLTTAHTQFRSTCAELGFLLAADKDVQGTVVDYLGLVIDSEKMEAYLPPNKKDRVLLEVNRLLAKPTVSKHDLQSVLGFLTFCTRVFPLGRPFLRHIFNMLNRPRAKQHLTTAARRDLQWWKTLLPMWSGISPIIPSRLETKIYTDASGKKGIGGYWESTREIFSTRLPRRQRKKHINYKEMFAILYAFAEWGTKWKGHRVTIYCDNEAVVKGINKRTIRGTAIAPLQDILLLAATLDIAVRAHWISTKENAIADALSRFDIKRIANLLGEQVTSSLRFRQPSNIVQKISCLKQNITSTTALLRAPAIISTNSSIHTENTVPSHTTHHFRSPKVPSPISSHTTLQTGRPQH